MSGLSCLLVGAVLLFSLPLVVALALLPCPALPQLLVQLLVLLLPAPERVRGEHGLSQQLLQGLQLSQLRLPGAMHVLWGHPRGRGHWEGSGGCGVSP